MRFARIALLLLLLRPSEGAGADVTGAERFWAAHIQPLFAEHCFKCHGNIETKSGLSLMSQADVLKGGDNGPAVLPGQPRKSTVYTYVLPDADPHMPPKGRPLAADEVALIKRWIEKLSPVDAAAATNLTGNIATANVSPLFRKPAWRPPSGLTPEQTIDYLVEQRWRESNVKPARVCDDHTYVRRVYLDVAGRIPLPSEVDRFISDRGRNKRAALVERLLNSAEYAVRMRELFDVVFMERQAFQTPRERRRNSGNAQLRDDWSDYLEWSFRENRPWNVIARELILARPATNETRGAAHFLYARKDNAQQMAEATGSALMGLQVKCAQCHDHPLAPEIKQSHYWGLVAAFNRSKAVETSAGPGVAESAIGGFIKFTNLKGASTEARLTFLDGRTVDEVRPGENEKEEDAAAKYRDGLALGDGKNLKAVPVPTFSRREQLAGWITGHDNPLLARAFVNRIWAMLLGRGLVHPVDRMDSSRPPSHPELLDWLTQSFVESGYDVKYLVRIITSTRAYQLDSRPAGKVRPAAESFACGLEKPLSAEVFARSMLIAVGNEPLPNGTVADFDLAALQRAFAEAFPEVFPTEPVSSLRQALFLSNNRRVEGLIASSSTNTLRRVAALDDRKRVEALFKRVLGRNPDRSELSRAIDYLQKRSEAPAEATRHLLWALLTSAEFRSNH